MNRADLELLCHAEMAKRAQRTRKKQTEPDAAQRPAYRHAIINATASGANTLVPAVPGNRIAVYEMLLWNTQQNTLQLLDGQTPLTGPLTNFPAQTGLLFNFTGAPHFVTSPGNPLVLNLAQSQPVTGYVRYREE
ncbi:MAG: hypothetical protein NZ765_09630 [Anaerolineae bacterium]|nr:hypothetical protein [Anaerolineae bacterium]MDW8071873.1 hypothetical protein [Anaerolineae bacterium]